MVSRVVYWLDMQLESRASSGIHEAARRSLTALYAYLKQAGRSTEPDDFYPVDVEVVADLAGWTINKVASLGVTCDDDRPVAAVSDFARRVIQVGVDDTTPEFRRFSIAHELGHVLLHAHLRRPHHEMLRVSPLRERGFPPPPPRPLPERQADRFAVELLLPPRAVTRRFESLFTCTHLLTNSANARSICRAAGRDSSGVILKDFAKLVASYSPESTVRSLATFFGVSTTAMGHRLTDLQLVLDS